ncbi:TPA: excisionase [Enterobacter ludwigii]|uniref:excisionase n=1 Tax=Enterobacter ludwigii TaxID=299767 RepID=UPI0033024463|nr:excisionase [Enterobacter ludwigii]HDR2597925.1 excisionase [Enterobacter ludwigii]
MALITLKEWNSRQPRPRSMEQVRRWVRSGRIQPPPHMDGREYLVEDHAVKINLNERYFAPIRNISKPSLRERIQYGRPEKKSQNK